MPLVQAGLAAGGIAALTARGAGACAASVAGQIAASSAAPRAKRAACVIDRGQRSVRKKARMSSTSRPGSSIAAKWPPRGISVQRVRLWLASTQRRGAKLSSLGNTAHAVGTATFRAGPPRARVLVVDARGRRAALRHPIQHHVGQQLVLREPLLDVAVRVAPRLELLDNPRRQADGRVVQPVADRLRLGALLLEVAALVLHEAWPRRAGARSRPAARRRAGWRRPREDQPGRSWCGTRRRGA